MARWVEKFPYFPQTIYGDNLMLQPHERNWFLQVSAGAGAQAIVNGVFGVRPQQNGAKTTFLVCSPQIFSEFFKNSETRLLYTMCMQGPSSSNRATMAAPCQRTQRFRTTVSAVLSTACNWTVMVVASRQRAHFA